MKKHLLVLGSILVVAFGLIQLVPYRVSNPSTRQEPRWDSPQTRALVVRACYDCHSNEVKVPWYGQVAPISWWLTNHVRDGRSALNFSEWKTARGEGAGDAIETIVSGSMPPSYYTWFGLHSSAKLSGIERQQLIAGLRASLR